MRGNSGTALPPGWAEARIGDLIGAGGLFTDGDWIETKDQDPEGEVRLTQLADIGEGRFLDRSARFLTGEKARELRCTLLEAGDVLIARMPDPLGRACIYPGGPKPAVTAVDVCIVRTGLPGVNHRWLMWFINSPDFRAAVESMQSGSTRKRISRRNLGTIRLPVPPRVEQDRIAETLDAHFTRLDAAVAALQRARANLRRYRASVLKAACEGRLVPTEAELARREGRDYEPADVLLQRILCERRARWEAEELERLKAKGKPPTDDRWKQKYKEPEPLDTNELPSLPEGWTWAPLAALGELKGGITKGFKPRAGEVHREVPYLRVANVQRGYLDLTDVRTIRAPLEKIEALRLQPGDVLFNEGGDRDKLGRGWIWSGEIPECIHQNHVFRARLYLPDLQPKYISWYANSAGQEYFVRQGKQTTNLASINLTKLGSLPVALPPAAEQARIAQEIERRLSLVDSMQTALETAGRRAERLRHAILRRAFTGRLVPQDPNDEPASALIERIRAQRQEQTELVIAGNAT